MLRDYWFNLPAGRVLLSPFAVNRFNRRLIVIGLLSQALLFCARVSSAEENVSFDAGFLHNSSDEKVDVSRFSYRNTLPPGNYDIAVILNEISLGRVSVRVEKKGVRSAVCTTRQMISLLHLKAGQTDNEQMARLDNPSHCLELEEVIPTAQASIDVSTLSIVITIPQAALLHRAQNEVDPSLWDEGVNALILGYDSSYYQSKQNEGSFKSFYNGDTLGLNVQGFRFRHQGALSWQENNGFDYSNLRNYVEHDLDALKARITLGDADTSGNLFDSFSFRGITLRTDDNMLPDSRRGYAPTIRGVAQTNARVTVRQNNSLLYETTVPPGPFSIDDLYPTGYGGDLSVTVRESDGRVTQFRVPYAAIPQLVRPGITLYSLSGGTLRNMNLSKRKVVAQATVQHGISNLLTGYSGILATRDYQAFLLGGAAGSSWGALALDATQTQTNSDTRRLSGQSYRATYSKDFNASNSTVSVAAWRFSSSGYLNLSDAMHWIDRSSRRTPGSNNLLRSSPRSRLSISLSQGLPDHWGQLYISGIRQKNHGNNSKHNQFQAGYSNAYRSLSWSLSVHQVNSQDGSETQYLLGLSLPLGGSKHPTYLNMNVNHDARGLNSQASINSSLGDIMPLDYSIGLGHDRQQSTSASAAASWRTPWTTLQSSVEKNRHSQSWSAGLNGSLVAVSDGITPSPWFSDTMALVDAPYAAGAQVEGQPGLMLDARGRALVPYLVAYRQNEINLDPQRLPRDVELKSTRQQIAPHAGALVKVNFATSRGKAVLIFPSLPDGKSLPFGAEVLDEHGDHLGLVAQGNIIYVRLPPGQHRLRVMAGEAPICTLSLSVSSIPSGSDGFERFNLPCLPVYTD